jgi:ABC-2 type transport system permease protein
MFAQIRSELLKFTTVRTSLIFALATAAFVALMVAIQGFSADTEFMGPLTDADTQRALFLSGSVAPLIAIVFGCLGITSEIRHHTIVSTLLFDANRVRVVLAKAVATLVAGATLAAVAMAVSLIGSVLVLVGTGTAIVVGSGEIATTVGGTLLSAALAAVFGLGIGGIVRNQALAVGAVLGLMLAVEPLVGSLLPDVAPWLPSSAVTVLAEAQSGAHIAVGSAAAALVAYVLVTMVGATLTLRRADIT